MLRSLWPGSLDSNGAKYSMVLEYLGQFAYFEVRFKQVYENDRQEDQELGKK